MTIKPWQERPLPPAIPGTLDGRIMFVMQSEITDLRKAMAELEAREPLGTQIRRAIKAEDERDALRAELATQVALVEKCMVAMNENADRGEKAEREFAALKAQLTLEVGELPNPVAARWPTVPGFHQYAGAGGCKPGSFGEGSEDLYTADQLRAHTASALAKQPQPVHPWYPEKCPITRRKFFMAIEHPDLGMVPTYGGPFDSYTIPHMLGEPDEQMHDRELECHRYDHDVGAWVDDEIIPLRVIHDDFLPSDEAPVHPVQEPVARVVTGANFTGKIEWLIGETVSAAQVSSIPNGTNLYAAPLPPVTLSDEDIRKLLPVKTGSWFEFARSIESALKGKP